MTDYKPKEEPLVCAMVCLQTCAHAVSYDGGSVTETSFRAVNGWRIEYYPRARIIRLWSERLAKRKEAPVTIIPIEACQDWQMLGDVERAPAEVIAAAR